MLKGISHSGGVMAIEEILFETPFNYMFPDLALSPAHKLPEGQDTTRALLALGKAMAVGKLKPTGKDPNTTEISSFFTYFGQFIDHDLTARTDRETETSQIFSPDGGALPIVPIDPEEVVATLRNGRRAQLDLDSVYGDGPSLHLPPNNCPPPKKGGAYPGTKTEADSLYDGQGRFNLQKLKAGIIDLPRPHKESAVGNPRQASIADERNDENINISQLHAAILAYHNAIMDGLTTGIDGVSWQEAFPRARQLVRWTYQFIVVNQYLKTVCDKIIVEDVLRNGPNFYGIVSGGEPLFMPLEFSVAGFRFGHSMVRPSYDLRNGNLQIDQILGPATAQRPGNPPVAILEKLTGNKNYAYRLLEKFTVDWSKFFAADAPNKARKIDPLIAQGLGHLTFVTQAPGVIKGSVVMAHLAQRNLLRGFSLSIPTGQAVAEAYGIQPIHGEDLFVEGHDEINDALRANSLSERTPLWYYVLKEAELHSCGQTLGQVGSRLVAETIIGMLKVDPNSYLNQYRQARSITKDGIEIKTANGRKTVCDFEGLLAVAGLYAGGKTHLKDAPPRDRWGMPVAEPEKGKKKTSGKKDRNRDHNR